MQLTPLRYTQQRTYLIFFYSLRKVNLIPRLTQSSVLVEKDQLLNFTVQDQCQEIEH